MDPGYARSQVDSAEKTTTLISSALPNNAGILYGGRSVFISAETLNVNGTIQSGCLDYNINLDTEAVKNAITEGKTDLSSIVFATNDATRLGILPKITYEDGKIVIGDVMAMGGDITLFGNIISTGNGKLSVADGMGNIKITANQDYELKLGRVDTGLGAEGTIRIIDTSKGNGHEPLTTVYTRENGRYYVQSGASTKQEVSGTDNKYETTANRWLETVLGNQTDLTWKYTYDKDVGYAFGIAGDWLAKNDSYVTNVNGNATVSKTMPIGTYLTTRTDLDSNNTLYGSYERTATDAIETRAEIRDTGYPRAGFGHRHYYHDYTAKQSFTENFTTYLNASQAIGIEFTGNETNASVDISGAKRSPWVILSAVRGKPPLRPRQAISLVTGRKV